MMALLKVAHEFKNGYMQKKRGQYYCVMFLIDVLVELTGYFCHQNYCCYILILLLIFKVEFM